MRRQQKPVHPELPVPTPSSSLFLSHPPSLLLTSRLPPSPKKEKVLKEGTGCVRTEPRPANWVSGWEPPLFSWGLRLGLLRVLESEASTNRWFTRPVVPGMKGPQAGRCPHGSQKRHARRELLGPFGSGRPHPVSRGAGSKGRLAGRDGRRRCQTPPGRRGVLVGYPAPRTRGPQRGSTRPSTKISGRRPRARACGVGAAGHKSDRDSRKDSSTLLLRKRSGKDGSGWAG